MTETTDDLFGPVPQPVIEKVKREEEAFGRLDARTGLGLVNGYSGQLIGERLAAYQRGWSAGRREFSRAK